MKFRRLKVYADPNAIQLSRVVDAETGDLIGGVTGIRWESTADDEYPRVTLIIDANFIDFEVTKTSPAQTEKATKGDSQ